LGFITRPYRFAVEESSFDSLHGDTSLVAYYKFNESSGNIINKSLDGAKIANSDLVVTGATYGATGILGDALSFDGVNDYAIASSSAASAWGFLNQTGGVFTIIAWVKADAFSQVKNIATTTNFNANDNGFLWALQTDRHLNCLFGDAPDDLVSLHGSSFPNDTTNFHMCMIRYDDATGVVGISVDDGTEATDTGNNLTTSTTPESQFTVASGIGVDIFLDGDMDEVSVWSKRLSDTEITDLYNGGAGRRIY